LRASTLTLHQPSAQTIGKTVEGRPINGVLIASANNTRTCSPPVTTLFGPLCGGMKPGPTLHANHTGKVGIVYNGGQHAREWISPMTNAYIANQLVSLYGKVSECVCV
jgi:hypothetical protein